MSRDLRATGNSSHCSYSPTACSLYNNYYSNDVTDVVSFSEIRRHAKMWPHSPNKDLPCIKISCTFWSLSQPFTSSWSWGLSLNTGLWLSTSSLKTPTSTSKWLNTCLSQSQLRNNQTDTDDGFSATGATVFISTSKANNSLECLHFFINVTTKVLNVRKEELCTSQCVRASVSFLHRLLLARGSSAKSNLDVSSLMNGSHPVLSPDWDHHTVLAGMWVMKRSNDPSFRFWIFPSVITDWFCLC